MDPAHGQDRRDRDDAFFNEDPNGEPSDKGFIVGIGRCPDYLAYTGSLMWMTFGLKDMCCAVEMMHISMPRYDMNSFRHFARARLTASVRRDDRCRHADQQDGARSAQGLRPDARAALCDFYGLLRQWRRLLPLFYSVGCVAVIAWFRSIFTSAGLPKANRVESAAYTVSSCFSRKKIRPPGTIELIRLSPVCAH